MVALPADFMLARAAPRRIGIQEVSLLMAEPAAALVLTLAAQAERAAQAEPAMPAARAEQEHPSAVRAVAVLAGQMVLALPADRRAVLRAAAVAVRAAAQLAPTVRVVSAAMAAIIPWAPATARMAIRPQLEQRAVAAVALVNQRRQSRAARAGPAPNGQRLVRAVAQAVALILRRPALAVRAAEAEITAAAALKGPLKTRVAVTALPVMVRRGLLL